MEKIIDNKLPLTRIQKLIGKLMLQSKQQKPCGYIKIRTDLTDLAKTRKKFCKTSGIRVTTNDFFFCAIARAVKQFPLMAASFTSDRQYLKIASQVGIGFAVAAAQGLVVPVITNSTEKTLTQIARDSAALLEKARANKLMPDDFDGDNIVLSGLGMYGITSFLAIAPPGATAIISIGRPVDTMVPRDGEIKVRKIMSVAMAFDTRIVTEVYAAKFLTAVTKQLEDPASLID